jgi:hypothetical protein
MDYSCDWVILFFSLFGPFLRSNIITNFYYVLMIFFFFFCRSILGRICGARQLVSFLNNSILLSMLSIAELMRTVVSDRAKDENEKMTAQSYLQAAIAVGNALTFFIGRCCFLVLFTSFSDFAVIVNCV